MTDELIASLIVVMAFFQVVFVIATIFKNNGLVDVSWGLGFIVASWIIAIRNSQFLILLIPITIW
jgi:steroid 5-alpha reductase family enzyme